MGGTTQSLQRRPAIGAALLGGLLGVVAGMALGIVIALAFLAQERQAATSTVVSTIEQARTFEQLRQHQLREYAPISTADAVRMLDLLRQHQQREYGR